jgi:anti-anti-sigma factor
MSAPKPRHLKERTEQQILVLTVTTPQLRGDELADELGAEILDAVARHGANHVVVDLAAVEYLSSVVFRPLLQLHAKIKEVHGRIVLCSMSEVVAEVLQLTRMVSTSGSHAAPFEQQPDVPAAIASLTKPPKPDGPA